MGYSVNIGSAVQSHIIDNNTIIYLPIIQGQWDSKQFTGTSEINQTYQLELRNGKGIENNNIEVYVNGQQWEIKNSIYDLLTDELACVVHTSYNGGVDLKFGNGNFGKVPEIGELIEFRFLTSDGASGSLFRRALNEFSFIDSVIDRTGSYVDTNKLFDIEYYTDINFGANAESVAFTKNMLPLVSNNYVIGTPQQYAYHIKKVCFHMLMHLEQI